MRIADLGLACWPVGVTIAVAAAGLRFRDSRRRNALNRALHELRRPLQALVLSSGSGQGPGVHALRVVICALDDLDREINGTARRLELRPVDCRALVQPAVERWRGIAAAMRRSLVLRWRAGTITVLVDPDRVAQALDNLIDNALRHGGLRVSVDAEVCASGVRITVRDSGGGRQRPARSVDARHGHGLAIASRVAAEHGGSFRMLRTPAGATAVLELPLAPLRSTWQSGRWTEGRRSRTANAQRAESPPSGDSSHDSTSQPPANRRQTASSLTRVLCTHATLPARPPATAPASFGG